MKTKPNFIPHLDDNKVLRIPYNTKYASRLLLFLANRGMVKFSISQQLDYLEVRFEKAASIGNFYEKLIPFLQVTQEHE